MKSALILSSIFNLALSASSLAGQSLEKKYKYAKGTTCTAFQKDGKWAAKGGFSIGELIIRVRGSSLKREKRNADRSITFETAGRFKKQAGADRLCAAVALAVGQSARLKLEDTDRDTRYGGYVDIYEYSSNDINVQTTDGHFATRLRLDELSLVHENSYSRVCAQYDTNNNCVSYSYKLVGQDLDLEDVELGTTINLQ